MANGQTTTAPDHTQSPAHTQPKGSMSTPHLPLMTEPDTARNDRPAPVVHELDALRDAVYRLRQSTRQLESARDDAAHPQLAKVLDAMAELRNVGVHVVEEKAEEDGFTLSDNPTGDIPGKMRRGITGLRSALMGDDALIRSVVKSERDTQEALHNALGEGLPNATHRALRSASRSIDSALAQLEALAR